MNIDLIKVIDKQRSTENFLTIEELLKLNENGNKIFDVFSTLISRNVKVGNNNVIFPSTVLRTDISSSIEIGDNNIIGTGTFVSVENGDKVKIGSNCRFDGKINIYGNCEIGDGCQILGYIQVYDCVLENGGSYKEKDPNLRGAVLKGVGRAKKLYVRKGYVINGTGDFKQEDEELQINYHKQ